MNFDKYISIVEKQESILQFPKFDRKDAWELGLFMASRILQEDLVLAASIRLANGFVLFQYAAEGTTKDNENWMIRKFNVVRDLEISSLLFTLQLGKDKQTLEEKGLDPRHHVACGGAFPIHVSGTGVIGAVIVSGMPHLVDHDFLVETLSRFLKKQGVPGVPLNVKI
jgi:uncharacterized protein (UPF0303 family)